MANTSSAEDRRFLADVEVVPHNLLELAAEWISSNLNPEDVFDVADLDDWAKRSGYVKEEDR